MRNVKVSFKIIPYKINKELFGYRISIKGIPFKELFFSKASAMYHLEFLRIRLKTKKSIVDRRSQPRVSLQKAV